MAGAHQIAADILARADEGAATTHPTPTASSARANANPLGPAS